MTLQFQKKIEFVIVLVSIVFVFACQNAFAQKKKTQPKKISNSSRIQKQENEPKSQNSISKDTDSLASLEETTNWLTEKLKKHTGTWYQYEEQGKVLGEAEVTYPTITFNQCQLSFSRREKVSGRVHIGIDTSDAEVELNLADFDPVNIKTGSEYRGSYLELKTYGEKKTIKKTEEVLRQLTGNALSEADSIIIYLRANDEITKRIIKGFQHAIKLCGGKVEPF